MRSLLLTFLIACTTAPPPRIPNGEVVATYDGPVIAFAGDDRSIAWIANATEPPGEAYGRDVWQVDAGGARVVYRYSPPFADRADAIGPWKVAFGGHQLFVEQYIDVATQLLAVEEGHATDLQIGGEYTFLIGVDGPFIAQWTRSANGDAVRVLDPRPDGDPWTITVPLTAQSKFALGYGKLIVDGRVITLGVGETGTLDYGEHVPRKLAATPDGALLLDATGLYRVTAAGMQWLIDDPAAPFIDSARDASIVAVGDDVWTAHNPPSTVDPADSLLVHIDGAGAVTTIPLATDRLSITRAADSLLVATEDALQVTFYRIKGAP